MDNIGCYKILKLIVDLPSEEYIKNLIGKRWDADKIIQILTKELNACKIERLEKYGDIILSGKHIGIFDGKNKIIHYLKRRKVYTDIKNIRIDEMMRIPCQQQ